MEKVIQNKSELKTLTCLEPACGAGHMAKVLSGYFDSVHSSDIYSYGYGSVSDYLSAGYSPNSIDWIITNPPFRLAEEFVLRSLDIARIGVAILARTVFLESVGRYSRIFSKASPSVFAQFSERVPMVKGRLDEKASTATGYGWLVWYKDSLATSPPQLMWIPPCRKALEREGDYLDPRDDRSSSSYRNVGLNSCSNDILLPI
ncbi:MAG: SAM-dependent methyltransferase [Methylocystis sp.]